MPQGGGGAPAPVSAEEPSARMKIAEVKAFPTSFPVPPQNSVTLGYQEPAALVDEARIHVEAGYKAVKLRLGDAPRRDVERVAAVRKALGDDIALLTDANTGYSVADARAAMPGLEANGVGWLE